MCHNLLTSCKNEHQQNSEKRRCLSSLEVHLRLSQKLAASQSVSAGGVHAPVFLCTRNLQKHLQQNSIPGGENMQVQIKCKRYHHVFMCVELTGCQVERALP